MRFLKGLINFGGLEPERKFKIFNETMNSVLNKRLKG